MKIMRGVKVFGPNISRVYLVVGYFMLPTILVVHPILYLRVRVWSVRADMIASHFCGPFHAPIPNTPAPTPTDRGRDTH